MRWGSRRTKRKPTKIYIVKLWKHLAYPTSDVSRDAFLRVFGICR